MCISGLNKISAIFPIYVLRLSACRCCSVASSPFPYTVYSYTYTGPEATCTYSMLFMSYHVVRWYKQDSYCGNTTCHMCMYYYYYTRTYILLYHCSTYLYTRPCECGHCSAVLDARHFLVRATATCATF